MLVRASRIMQRVLKVAVMMAVITGALSLQPSAHASTEPASVRQTGAGHVTGRVDPAAVAGEVVVLDETLETGGAIAGVCRNGATGELYDLLRVEVYRLDGTSGTWSVYSGTSSTAEGGIFTVNMLPPGTYRVSAAVVGAWPPVRVGYAPDAMTLESAGDITVTSDHTSVADVTVYPVEQITGSITSTLSGKKIDHTELALWRQDGDGIWSVVATAAPQLTDDYVFNAVVPGVYRLTARDTLSRYYDRGYPAGQNVDNAEDIVVTRGLRTRKDVTLDPILGTLRGTVRNSVTGLPVAGAIVGYQPGMGTIYLGPVQPVGTTIADGNGEYEFQYEAEQFAFRVWDAAGEYVPGEYGITTLTRIVVGPGQTTVTDLLLNPRGRFTMTVRDAETGEPVPGVSVSYGYAPVTTSASALTDSDGAMATTPLDPGWYCFALSDPTGRYQPLTYSGGNAVRINSGQSLDLTATLVPNHFTTTLVLDAPRPTRLGSALTVFARLAKSEGGQVAGRSDVTLWSSVNGGDTWTEVGSATDEGTPGVYRAEVTLNATTSVQMRFAGDRFFLGSESASATAVPATAVSSSSIEGADRIATAIATSKRAFPAGASAVVIATGSNWPDALGGSALAGALNGPILLTSPKSLPTEVEAEIARLSPSKVIILGSTTAVTQAVQDQISSLAGVTVERIAGSDRYVTAQRVADKTVAVLGAQYDGTAFVSTGANFPDALGASPLAAAKGWPIYLVNPTQGGNAGLVAVMHADGVSKSIVLGGTNVIAASVETELKRVLGAGNVVRIAGANRYETAIKVAEYGIASAGLRWDGVAIATGQNFPDALAGGVLQAKRGSILLLTPSASLDPGVAATLKKNKGEVVSICFLGSRTALSADVRTAVLSALK